MYLQNQAARKIGIASTKLRDVREAGFIEHIALPGRTRMRVQYSIGVIDRLAELVRSTPVLTHFPGKFGLPTYAIEQLVFDGLLERETDPAVNAIRKDICVRPDSVHAFVDCMNNIARIDEAPAGAVPVRVAARRIGGRLKPWSHIVRALKQGDIPTWSATACFQARTWLVRPEDLTAFDDVLATDTANIAKDWINLDDLGELLNITPKMIAKLSSDLRLEPVERGRADCIPLQMALQVARQMSTTAEVGAQLSIHSKSAEHMLRHLKVTPVSWLVPARPNRSRSSAPIGGIKSCSQTISMTIMQR